MAACELEWVPDSLYNTSISAIIALYNVHKKDIEILPDDVQFDIYYKLYNKGEMALLGQAFCDLDVISRVLKVHDKRHLLHHCFQAVMDNYQLPPARTLADAYAQRCCAQHADSNVVREKCMNLGITLGRFLSDSGWYCDAGRIYSAALQLTKLTDLPHKWKIELEICLRLVHVKTANCEYNEAEESWREASFYIAKAEERGKPFCKALFYMEYCALLFSKSCYDRAYTYCCLALREIQHNALSPRATVDIFRQCAKACVVKRDFKRAEILIKYAVQVAREKFGNKHDKYADALLDYGFYLLNVDAIFQAVQVYQAALDIRISVFGGYNLHVALAHEDLAYSSYVQEYSSGKFQNARRHAECSIDIIKKILPQDHLLLASSKRVKALILEEIAIDTHNKAEEQQLLQEAKELHLHSLELARKAFGEENVQTAKHYGNLGRLYQSMQNYEEAEMMHLKAIQIKERLLGLEDYEVALSVGHLASIYNYDMHKYEQAEQLYMRSISIGRKLFGPGYSGLEYDYRGLIKLYASTENMMKVHEYHDILQEWNQIRDRSKQNVGQPLDIENLGDMSHVITRFFEIESS